MSLIAFPLSFHLTLISSSPQFSSHDVFLRLLISDTKFFIEFF